MRELLACLSGQNHKSARAEDRMVLGRIQKSTTPPLSAFLPDIAVSNNLVLAVRQEHAHTRRREGFGLPRCLSRSTWADRFCMMISPHRGSESDSIAI